MANRHTAILGDQLDDSILGKGIIKDTSDDFSHKLDVNVDDSTVEISSNAVQVKDAGITNAKLAGGITDDKLDSDYIQTSEVDDSTIEFAGGNLNVKDLGIDTVQLADEAVTESKIDIFNAPVEGYYLKYTSNGLEWADVDEDAVKEDDLIFHEIPSGSINSINTSFTLSSTPVTGTVQVFLNGLLQAPGTGMDYTVSGNAIEFAKAPRTNSDLYAHYVVA